MDIDQYLHRIGYRGDRTPTAETLRNLQITHLRAVPYENLEILAGREPSLEISEIFKKIVVARRGGWCYELNVLFANLLRALGFRLDMLSARIDWDGTLGPDGDHMILLVHLEEPWIADVGNARWSLEPLALDPAKSHREGERVYRFAVDGTTHTLMLADQGGPEQRQYVFELSPRREQDFSTVSRLKATSPQSRFTQGRLCSLRTKTGQITLSGTRIITVTHGERRERPLRDEQEGDEILCEQFRLVPNYCEGTPNIADKSVRTV